MKTHGEFSAPGVPAGRTVSIVGIGSYAPDKVLTNKDLEKIVDTTDEWIVTRTGMRERRIAAPEQATSDLAAEAAKRALASANMTAADVEMIVVGTITPDLPFPNTACLVQSKIGARHAFCFSVEAACSGFVYALEIARNFIASGTVRNALVIGSETMSRILDWQDRATCVLFGDGAGAVVLQAVGAPRGIMASSLGANGALADLLLVPAGGSRQPASEETVRQRQHYLKMSGKEVFKHAVTSMTRAGQDALKRSGLTIADVDWIIPHQANQRIISAIGERLGVPPEKVIVNVDKYGNTSGASVGLAMDEAWRDGRLKQGDIVLLVVFGGGFTWGATVLEWWL